MKLKRGYTYLLQVMKVDKPYFYIIHQTGERSWFASLFSHTSDLNAIQVAPVISGNSGNLIDLVSNQGNTTYFKCVPYIAGVDQAKMRVTMSKIFLEGVFE